MQPLSKIQLYRFSAVCSLALMLSPKGHSLPVIGHWVRSSEFVTNPQLFPQIQVEPVNDASMQRRGVDVLRSVIAFLNWRVESARVPFVSWRNQPPEVGCLTHAINLCNQALNDPRPAYDAEREQLRLELGAALEAAKRHANDDEGTSAGTRNVNGIRRSLTADSLTGESAVGVPKKLPQSEKLKSGSAAA